METPHVVALVTCPVDAADGLAHAIVDRRLAACVNVVPLVRSVFRWQGEVQHDEEALLVVKTARERVEAIDECLRELHPYDVYELVALDVVAGSEPYLAWILAGSGPAADPAP